MPKTCQGGISLVSPGAANLARARLCQSAHKLTCQAGRRGEASNGQIKLFYMQRGKEHLQQIGLQLEMGGRLLCWDLTEHINPNDFVNSFS